MATTVRGTIAGMAQRANPAFAVAVVAIPLAALGYALTVASIQGHTYVHVMAGVLWTGIDVFIGAVLGPVIGGLDDEESAAVFQRLTPKTAFLLPSLATVTIASGIALALELGYLADGEGWLALFTAANAVPILLLLGWRLDAWRDWRWQLPFGVATVGSLAWVALTLDALPAIEPAIAVALAIVTILSVQGFGFLMPGELRIYREMTSANPDSGVIAAIGKQNAMLGGVQGAFQLLLILDMVYLRYGGFPF
ncbi:conserved hypothetical protein [Halorhabdus utahensis DSM 12940]|uniref:Uncharacterized protein n=2 Tax=Halorhabdus utahensis TaxID=146826 RepID=C7NNE5_HALUD|nr:hypothetical protein [Halorhabdus utahensis]ACV11545.1 conserved hypothetical protein [Halorhabdus utahensis DSM 12940]